MAKRYIDTGFYKSPFVRGLKGSLKSLYGFIICDSEGSGIWTKDLIIASAYIGFEVTEKDFDIFVKAGKAIDLKNGRFFFPDFIEHQYPQGLSEKNPAHNNFIKELKKYSLIDDNLKVVKRDTKGTIEVPMVMVTEKVEEKVIVQEKTEFEKTFEAFIEMRKKIRKPATDRAIELLLKKINKYPESQRIPIIEQSIMNSWQDFFDLRVSVGQQKQEEKVGKVDFKIPGKWNAQ